MKVFKSLVATCVCCAMVMGMATSAFAAKPDEDSCEKGHTVPNGYVLYDVVEGNNDVQFTVTTVAAGSVSIMAPILSTPLTIGLGLASLLYIVNPGDELRGNYVQYIYYDSSSAGFWEHTFFYAIDQKNNEHYLGCEVNRYWISNK